MRNRRGVALMVVLWSVALLATLTAMATSAARMSAATATNIRSRAVARAMAESGVLAATADIGDSLRVYGNDAAHRDAYLSRLEPSVMGAAAMIDDSLGEGRFAVTIVDVSARLDVNTAGVDGLTSLFATATSTGTARTMAEQIESAIVGAQTLNVDAAAMARDSLAAMLLGRERSPLTRLAFESLDAVRDVVGDNAGVLAQVASQLTVDGDGRINRRAASRAVLAAASGSLVDAPSRLLIVARGWERGHPLSREIEAVYDVATDGLHLVRWRERDR